MKKARLSTGLNFLPLPNPSPKGGAEIFVIIRFSPSPLGEGSGDEADPNAAASHLQPS